MRTIVAKLSVVAALLSPLAMMGVVAAPAGASGGTLCSGNSGSITLSPGLETSAQVQNIVIQGSLSGCSGGSVTGATYIGHLTTKNPADCETLTTGEPETGTIVVKWSPKGQGSSHGTLNMTLSSSEASMSGKLEKGPFERLGIFGTSITPEFGACGGSKKLKSATFTGSPFRVTGRPKAQIESPKRGGVYTLNSVVPTTFSCVESTYGPGLESCVDSNGGSGTSGTLNTSTTGSHTYTVTATSVDGLTGKASIKYKVVA